MLSSGALAPAQVRSPDMHCVNKLRQNVGGEREFNVAV